MTAKGIELYVNKIIPVFKERILELLEDETTYKDEDIDYDFDYECFKYFDLKNMPRDMIQTILIILYYDVPQTLKHMIKYKETPDTRKEHKEWDKKYSQVLKEIIEIEENTKFIIEIEGKEDDLYDSETKRSFIEYGKKLIEDHKRKALKKQEDFKLNYLFKREMDLNNLLHLSVLRYIYLVFKIMLKPPSNYYGHIFELYTKINPQELHEITNCKKHISKKDD